MKLNNKGFMMAEVVVVSAIVLMFMGTIYSSYNKMYSTYRTRLTYLDTVTLYRLGYYRDILIENNKMGDVLTNVKSSNIIDIYDSTNGINSMFNLPETEKSNNIEDRVLLIYNNKNNISENILNNKENIHETFKDYISYLSKSTKLDSNYVMVMERCNLNNENDCKYAYLEIYDGNE